ncbi:P-loop NTPase [Halorubrum sp. DTA46]|uniref:nucleotide-binding protein n=1 Tax=Halorubrum sp. DTA46 TaxID=3402162 RepID=UPI003AAA530E
MTTVYAVASAKGGVGKTTTTAAIATILADSGADVVAIDADIGMANLAAAVGVTPGETTLHDVLAGEAEPLDAVYEGPSGLRVVPGTADLDAYAAADPSVLGAVVSAFDDADYVFVDAGAGLSHDSTLPLGLADETLLVSTAERSALGDTDKTRQLTERLGGTVAGAAITRIDADHAAGGEADGADLVAELLDAPVLGRIPEDESVLRAADAGEPLPLFAPDAPATRGYRDLTRALTGAEIDGDGLSTGVANDEAERGDAEQPSDADDGAEGPESIAAEHEERGDSEGGDSERGDGAEADDDEDGIVADESPVADDDSAAERDTAGSEPSAAPDGPGSEVADETEMVGEDHVNGDDLEAMIEADDDESAAFDDREADTADESDENDESDESDIDEADESEADESGRDDEAIADADEVASRAREGESETVAGDETADSNETSDIDDELVGSVPFRDDDTGTMNTALTGDEAAAAGDDGAADEGDSDDGDREGRERDDEERDDRSERGDDKRGGFLSRLFGR